jgi:hypothetical protein
MLIVNYGLNIQDINMKANQLIGVILISCVFSFFASVSVCHAAPQPLSVVVGWAWPGDDSLSGTCAGIDCRYATDSSALTNNFGGQVRLTIPNIPKIALTADSCQIDSVFRTETVYFIAARWFDEVPNFSRLSNIVRVYRGDITAPASALITIRLR